MLFAVFVGCIVLTCYASAANGQTQPPPQAMPDVLVLVLSGVAPVDQISINYSTAVPEDAVKADIRALEKQTAWLVDSVRVSTRTVGGRQTASGSFNTLAVVNYKEGLIDVSPFIDVLKRYQSIQVNYLLPEGFNFRGLKDFENEFVKIHLDQRGTSYLYRIRVKNNRFDRLVLPLRQPERKTEVSGCLGGGGRLACAVIIALLCGVAVYVAVRVMYRRGRGV